MRNGMDISTATRTASQNPLAASHAAVLCMPNVPNRCGFVNGVFADNALRFPPKCQEHDREMLMTEQTNCVECGAVVEPHTIACDACLYGAPQPSEISKLLDMMERFALDEDRWGPCGELAHGSTYVGRGEYADAGPIYPAAPYTMRFWGNFKGWSHAFSIDTDDAEVIEILTTAIAMNRAKFGRGRTQA